MIDTHAHLNFPQLAGELPSVLERAKQAGVEKIILPGTDLDTSTSSVEMSAEREEVFAAVGLHPHEADKFSPAPLASLEELIDRSAKVVAVGEVGLDYLRMEEGKERQQALFLAMLRLAKKRDLPVIIHCREAFSDTYRLLKEEANPLVVIHCFCGSQEEAKKWLDLGCLLSFTGMLTFTKNQALRDLVAWLPLERLMLETDAPYLAPQSRRGTVNEPAYLLEIAETVAAVKNISLEEVERVTSATAGEFFHLGEAAVK